MTTLDELRTGGAVRPITRWGTPVMHARTEPVSEFGDELHTLVRGMFATMAAAHGVGLAATQVGVGLAVFVYECPDADDVVTYGVICNPVVELPDGRDRQLDSTDEGCLSLPGAYEMLARPDRAICRGQDAFGRDIEVRGTGLLSRCLQHESDHLYGTVFGDRLSSRRRKSLYKAHDQVAYRYPADWPVSPKQPFDPVLEKP
ncbi:MAG TPA: peptide deformylase [Propionibacteriaceae bacterium]|nr:peptide deformylase [Propionibacteriaceae bacterium]